MIPTHTLFMTSTKKHKKVGKNEKETKYPILKIPERKDFLQFHLAWWPDLMKLNYLAWLMIF